MNLGIATSYPGVLTRAGVKVGIVTDHSVIAIHLLPICAVWQLAGMDEYETLKAITINPAEINGIADRVGSIEPQGRRPCNMDQNPVKDLDCKVKCTVINGEVVYEA